MSYVYRGMYQPGLFFCFAEIGERVATKGRGREEGERESAYLDISSCPTLISPRGISPLVAGNRTRDFFDEIRSRLLGRAEKTKEGKESEKERERGEKRDGENGGSLLAFFSEPRFARRDVRFLHDRKRGV